MRELVPSALNVASTTIETSTLAAASYRPTRGSSTDSPFDSNGVATPIPEKHPAFILGELLRGSAQTLAGFVRSLVDLPFRPFILPVAEAVEVSRDLTPYKTHDEALFTACASGCDVALTFRGIKKLRLEDLEPEYQMDYFFPIYAIHVRDMKEMKQNNDFVSFKKTMKQGLQHIEQELEKAGRLQNVVAHEYNKLSGTPNLSLENMLNNISEQLFRQLKVKKTAVNRLITSAFYTTVQKLPDTPPLQILLSDTFYHIVKETLLLPRLRRLGSEKSLQKQFDRIDSFSPTPEIDRVKAVYRKSEDIGLSQEQYDDRMEKTRLMARKGLTTIVIDRTKAKNPSSLIASATMKVDLGVQVHYVGDTGEEFYEPESATHEPMHQYENEWCLDWGSKEATISINSPDNEFREPCGNNIRQYTQLPAKLSAAFSRDYKNFKKFIIEEPKEIRKQEGWFSIEHFKELCTKYGYPTIPAEQVSSVTKRVHTAFDRTFEACANLENPLEIIPNITQELSPRELLDYAPNTAYIRSFTIHNDGRDETKLYINLLQGNRQAVKALVTKDPSLLDKEYDGIPLIYIARTVQKWDTTIQDGVRPENKARRQYRNMVKWVEAEYAKPRGREKTGSRIEL